MTSLLAPGFFLLLCLSLILSRELNFLRPYFSFPGDSVSPRRGKGPITQLAPQCCPLVLAGLRYALIWVQYTGSSSFCFLSFSFSFSSVLSQASDWLVAFEVLYALARHIQNGAFGFPEGICTTRAWSGRVTQWQGAC